MARKNSSTISDEELEPSANESETRKNRLEDSPLDARMLDLDDEAESPFLRGQKRVPVRRGGLPRNAASRVKIVLVLIVIVAAGAVIFIPLHQYMTQSWRFRLDSSDDITVTGMDNVSRAQVLDVMASDIDRNIFFVPLEQRKKQLEQIPWVQSASVMRLLPNRLNVAVKERTPAAFVEVNSHIQLIDADGVIMDLPAGQSAKYSFPVIVGISDSDPLSTRAARMKIYSQLIKQLDSDGARYSGDLSDVDLSDPDDVKATVTDPQGAVLVHLGSSNFLERFKTYVTHVQEWRTQFRKLESVDLRYEHQVIVNPDSATAEPKQSLPDSTTAGNSETAKPDAEHKKAASKKTRKHS
ncbi:MAG: FtsQ-type POTRA domain-containing protein [Candidatus Korobacteraceae bacterium]